MKQTANEQLLSKQDKVMQFYKGKIEEFTSGWARNNTYYMFDEMKHSFILLCSGIELRQP